MAEITLSPIPIDNGTLSPGEYRDVIWLKDNIFITIFSQINPNHVFGMVFEVNNMTSTSPTYTILRTQILSEYNILSNTSFRLCKLTDTKIVVLMVQVKTTATTLEASVINVDPDTYAITKVNSTDISISNLVRDNALKSYNTNPLLVTYKRINDNTLFLSVPNHDSDLTNGAGVRLYKIHVADITFDISSDLLFTSSGVYGFISFCENADGNGLTLVGYYISKYGANSRWYLGLPRSFIGNYCILNKNELDNIDSITSLSFTSWAAGLGAGNGLLFQDANRNGLFFQNNYQYRTITEGTFAGLLSLGNIRYNYAGYVYNVTNLSDNLCLICSSLSGSNDSGSTFNFYSSLNIRIVNTISNSATIGTSDQISTPPTFKFNKLGFVEKIKNNVIVLYGMTATSTTDLGSFNLYFMYSS